MAPHGRQGLEQEAWRMWLIHSVQRRDQGAAKPAGKADGAAAGAGVGSGVKTLSCSGFCERERNTPHVCPVGRGDWRAT